MKIISINLAKLTIPLKRPFITSVRRTESVEDIVVMIKTDDGRMGYGSGAATPAITGDTQDSMISAITHYIGPKLIGHRIDELNYLLQLTETALQKNTSAKAAVDMALHDLFAQKCSLPLYKLLGGDSDTQHTVITVSLKNADEMVADALALVKDGFHTLKIKLGMNPSEDLARVKAIRAAVGNDIKLLVDANQGWNVKEAMQVIQAFKQNNLGIDLIEQPVKAVDWMNLKLIRDRVSSMVVADESCFSAEDALNIAKNNVADGINIKLMKSGGLTNANAIYHIAKAAHIQVMVGCMLESPIGVAAIASFAASKPDIFLADLDPMALIRENYVQGGAQLKGSQIILSNKPGLGIEGFSNGLTLVHEIK